MKKKGDLEDKRGSNIIKGSLTSIVITIFLLAVFAAVLTYTNISENCIPGVIISITAVSILIGSRLSTSTIKKNGILNGAMVGIIYISAIYLISSFVIDSFSLTKMSIIMIGIAIVSGAIGGIFSVNKN